MQSAAPVPFSAFGARKYVVDVDGNVQSDRFASLLTLGNLVLKATRFRTAYTLSLSQLPQVVPPECERRCE